MEKPRSQTLRRVAELLDARKVPYQVYPATDGLGFVSWIPESIETNSSSGLSSIEMYADGNDVHFRGTVPVEGAVIAICGPDKRLEDMYPMAKRHMSFANISMNLETDRRDVLMPIEKVDMLKEHMDRLKHKVNNQKTDLRRMHLKCMRQQDEITRMEDNALRMAVLYAGYSEGES